MAGCLRLYQQNKSNSWRFVQNKAEVNITSNGLTNRAAGFFLLLTQRNICMSYRPNYSAFGPAGQACRGATPRRCLLMPLGRLTLRWAVKMPGWIHNLSSLHQVKLFSVASLSTNQIACPLSHQKGIAGNSISAFILPKVSGNEKVI